jgi:hypothetical protein
MFEMKLCLEAMGRINLNASAAGIPAMEYLTGVWLVDIIPVL